jgi:hypothetical protein
MLFFYSWDIARTISYIPTPTTFQSTVYSSSIQARRLPNLLESSGVDGCLNPDISVEDRGKRRFLVLDEYVDGEEYIDIRTACGTHD